MNDKTQKPSRRKRTRNIVILIVIVALAIFIGIRYYFPFGEGVKTGQLNFVVRKGLVFKTYEGKLIQSGFWSDQAKGGGIQSNEFVFSIQNKAIADSLMMVGGQMVELHYKEYFGRLPWRGNSKYVVDGIINISPVRTTQDNLPPYTPPVN